MAGTRAGVRKNDGRKTMKATRHENQPWAARRLILLALVLVGSACDGSKGGSPTNPAYTGKSSNFIVHMGWDLLVDERLGTAWNQTATKARS
jgi:hypothetical protein